MERKIATAVALVCLASIIFTTGCQEKGRSFLFGGGPVGGTFHPFAKGLVEIIGEGMPETRIAVQRSGGSLANLKDVDRGELDMALVYAGDAYMGWEGRLSPDLPQVRNVRAVARLYGASAELVVLNDSPFRSPGDLRGKRVAIGGPGSGAALSAERFFRSLGIWEQVVPVHLGYSMAMADLSKGSVQAVWQLVGVPSASIMTMVRQTPLRLLDLEEALKRSGHLESYPFYTTAVIPRGTYPGQQRDILTFQESALWVARPEVDRDLIYHSLTRLFSEEGMEKMRRVHMVGGDLNREKGLMGVEIPLHPAAEGFWREQGLH